MAAKKRQKVTRLAYRSQKRMERFGSKPRKMRKPLPPGLLEQWKPPAVDNGSVDSDDNPPPP